MRRSKSPPLRQTRRSGESKAAYKLSRQAAKKGSNWQVSKVVEMCLMDAGDTCATAARRRRLEVIGFVLPHLQSHAGNGNDEGDEDDNDDAMKTLLAELILATKEQNAKTRLLAYQLLVDIPRRMEKEASERQGAIADGQVGNRAGVAAWLAQSDEGDKGKKKKNKNKNGSKDDMSDDDDSDDDDDDRDVILSDDDNDDEDDKDNNDNDNMAIENLEPSRSYRRKFSRHSGILSLPCSPVSSARRHKCNLPQSSPWRLLLRILRETC